MSDRPDQPSEEPKPGEELLRDLLSGELDPDTPEARRLLAASPELRRDWEALGRSGRDLDRLGSLEREVLAELGDGPQAGWDERARRTLGALGRAAAAPRPRRPWASLVAAAAAALVIGFLALRVLERLPSDGGGEGELYLGAPSRAPVPEAPAGELAAERLGSFTWAWSPQGSWQGSCTVVVYDDAGDRLLESGPVERDGETWRWTPTASELERLRDAGSFRWQVFAQARVGFSAASPLRSVSLR